MMNIGMHRMIQIMSCMTIALYAIDGLMKLIMTIRYAANVVGHMNQLTNKKIQNYGMVRS